MFRTLLLLLLFSPPVLAQTYDRADIVRGLCQPDGCDEFAIVGADPMTETDNGTLMRTRLKTFHASHAGRKELGEEDGYVYCSQTSPAVLADQDGHTMAFFLALTPAAQSREAIRRNANYHAVYFAICHGAEAGRAAVQNPAGVAEGLGYQVSLARPKMVTLERAEDIVGMPEGGRRGDALRADSQPRPADIAALEAGRSRQERRPAELRMGSVPARAAASVPGNENVDLLAVPRRLTNQAFDALDQIGSWMLGR
jgi:hypothetical protein